MKAGIQRDYAQDVRDSGCFALCIIEAAQRGRPDRDAPILIGKAIDLGFLALDMMVQFPQGNMMGLCREGAWEHFVVGPDYQPQDDEIAIERWKYTDIAGVEHRHFMLPASGGFPFWDPLGDSQTHKLGKCYEKRIFRRVKT